MNLNTQVVIVGGDPLARLGIRTLLGNAPGLTVIAELLTLESVGQIHDNVQPDVQVVVLDKPQMAIEIAAMVRRKYPHSRTVVLANSEDDAYAWSLVTSGIEAYVLQDEAESRIVPAVIAVAEGLTWFKGSTMRLLMHRTDTLHRQDNNTALSGREYSLLEMLAAGWSNEHIARDLGLGEQTVRNYLTRLYTKLQVHSRAEAVVWFRNNGGLARSHKPDPLK